MNLKNKKGLVGELLIFLVVMTIAAGFIYVVYLSGNQTAAEVYFKDDLRSVSLVADGIINTPNCLLYTEKDLLFQPPKTVSNRNTIDWQKVSDSKKGCLRKGPYLWNAVVENSEIKDEKREIKNYDADSCSEIGKRSFPILIKKGADLDSGKATVSLASKDAIAAFSKKGTELTIAVKNSGSCPSNFKINPTIINPTSGEIAFNYPITCNGYETGNLEKGKDAKFLCTIPQGIPTSSNIKVEISPSDMSYYSKEYRISI